TTQPFISTTATDNSPVNTYPITVSGAVDPNYAISYVQGTLTVTGNALTFNPIPSQPYGTGDFSPGASSSAPTSYTSSNTAVATIVSGNIHIVGGGSTVITANNGSTNLQQTLTVTPIPLSIMANGLSKTYGAVNPTLTLGYSGFVNGDGPSTLATPPSVSTTAVTGSGANTYPITASGAADTRYTISYVPGTMTVNPAALTITANNLSKPQGTANPILTVSYNSFVNNDTPASLATQPVITTTSATSSPVGTYPITASGAASPNYTISYVPGILTVTTSTLTFSAIPSKVYGTADFSAGATSKAGAITYTSSNTAVATIVSGKIHIIGAGTSAITANNGSTSLQQTLTVTPAALTITANSINKVYGATLSNGAGSKAFTTSGLIGGQTVGSVTMTYGTGAAATVAIGTYSGAAIPSAATGGTFTAGNYTITYNSNSIIVGRATLKITANNVTKSYGTTLTGGTGSAAFTSTGLANGQTVGSVTIAYGTGATATTAPGTYNGSITPSAATGGTFTAGNYTISYTTGNITVNKAALTITANNLTKTQGAANPTLTISYSGFVNGQTNTVLTTQPKVTTTATTSSPAGTYPITPSGAAAANYNISYVAGTLTITGNAFAFGPIPSKVFGTANFSPGATGSGTITYTSSNSAVATIVSNNIHIVGAGTSTITATSGSTKLTQTLTVTRATLTITANNINKAYGATLTTGAGSTAFTSTGLANGQTIGSVTMTYGTGAAATAALNTYTVAITPSAATGGTLTAANYNITYVKGNIVVVKAALKIIANNVTKTYGTSISGGTGSKAFTTTGLANGQTISSITIAYGTGAATTANAGNYSGAVTPSAATGGTFVAADYTITYTSGNITVSQVALKITANNQTKIQGKANPTLTVSYSGFVNGQSNTVLTTQPKITTTATTSSAVGKYPITASGAVGANYTITYVAGTLTISAQTKALVSVNRPILVAVTDSDKFDLAPMEPVVKQAVSPNGDGINDVLTIENIEQYPDNKVMLMNRNGTTIFEMTGYNNMNKVFDGHSNITRAMQQPGTYFYMVEYKVKEEVKHKTGYFIIKY
ncbi:MAG TPA: MBG domain-containing protein, partial [Mucilaginibacter sp.]